MRKKALAAALATVGVVLILVSTVDWFLIRGNRANYMYLTWPFGSMQPTISKGDVLRVELAVNASDIKADYEDGDIIVFRRPTNPTELSVARAVDVENRSGILYFRTKGDNNPGPDAWTVSEGLLIGKVVEVNPPIWTYSYFFSVVILATGITIMLSGVVIMVFSRARAKEIYQRYVVVVALFFSVLAIILTIVNILVLISK